MSSTNKRKVAVKSPRSNTRISFGLIVKKAAKKPAAKKRAAKKAAKKSAA